MRRSIKKAVAFTLAAVTMAANLSVSAPVKAAEYEEVKEVLPLEYDWGTGFGDNVIFVDTIDLSKDKDGSDVYLDELVVVDKNGQKCSVDVKDANGNIIHNEIIDNFQYLKSYFEPLN